MVGALYLCAVISLSNFSQVVQLATGGLFLFYAVLKQSYIAVYFKPVDHLHTLGIKDLLSGLLNRRVGFRSNLCCAAI